jgi:hypothetical protein
LVEPGVQFTRQFPVVAVADAAQQLSFAGQSLLRSQVGVPTGKPSGVAGSKQA